jgi:hypothetical protein
VQFAAAGMLVLVSVSSAIAGLRRSTHTLARRVGHACGRGLRAVARRRTPVLDRVGIEP